MNRPVRRNRRRRGNRRNRKRDLLILGGLFVALLIGKYFFPEPDPLTPSGRAQVIDGDSLKVDGVEIRLKGIDAPELDQSCERNGQSWPCGRESARQLRFFVRGSEVSCVGAAFDKHQRLLAHCRQGDREINRWMVEEGWAVSFSDYPDAESKARRTKRGLWSGRFERPSDWRERNPRR